MNKPDKECRSYLRGELVCKDGFPQLIPCWGGNSSLEPWCIKEELPVHFINEDGSPRMFRKG